MIEPNRIFIRLITFYTILFGKLKRPSSNDKQQIYGERDRKDITVMTNKKIKKLRAYISRFIQQTIQLR